MLLDIRHGDREHTTIDCAQRESQQKGEMCCRWPVKVSTSDPALINSVSNICMSNMHDPHQNRGGVQSVERGN